MHTSFSDYKEREGILFSSIWKLADTLQVEICCSRYKSMDAVETFPPVEGPTKAVQRLTRYSCEFLKIPSHL